MLSMNRTKTASTLLTVAAALNTWATSGLAKNRCEADLSRVQNEFCLGDQHLKGAPESLRYDWKLDDKAFDLTSKVCLTDGGVVGNRKDMILALDRSQGIQALDSSHRKVGADNISTARYIIEKLIEEAKARPEAAPKVGLVMFSTAPDCKEFDGAAIAVNRDFPCLYVKAKSLADTAQQSTLLNFLKAAEGKYSQGGASNSDYTIVGNLLAQTTLGLVGPQKAGLVLFSDGSTFKGEQGDPFAYLKSGNYLGAQDAALSSFKSSAVQRYRMVFALNPVESPMYSAQNHADTFSTMCEANGAPATDCDQGAVTYADAKTWPVNKLDLTKFARNLVETTGAPATNVVTIDAKEDIDAGLEALRITAGSFANIDAATYSVNGGEAQKAVIDGGRIGGIELPSGEVSLELTLKSGGVDFQIPLAVTTTEVEPDGKEFSDREMYCSAVEAETEAPGINLDNLQGGSASCGVVGHGAESRAPLAVALILPLALAIYYLGRRSGLVLLFFLALAANAPSAHAEQAGGLNALQYSPVVDGVGMTEKATTINQGGYNFGLFMDYANDPVEIGGEKNERINSIMDNLVTAHAVGNIGLLKNVSLGIHIPYVHNSDEQRAVEGDEVSGGQVGRPADSSINFKINITQKNSFSVGVMPIVTLPTGDSELLLGDGSTNYGGLFLMSGLSGKFSWAFSTGYLHRDKPLELKDERTNSVTVTGQYLNHAGVEYRYSPLISFGGNLQAKFTEGEHIDFTRSNPAEWMALAKLRPTAGLDVEAGFGTGIGKGYGSPDYRVFGGLTWVPDANKRYAEVPARKTPARKAAVAPAKKAAAIKRTSARR